MSSNTDLIEVLESIRAVRESVNQDLNALEVRVRRLLPPESPRRYQRLAQSDWAADMRSFIHETHNGCQAKNTKKA
jgi:hypothetical protein